MVRKTLHSVEKGLDGDVLQLDYKSVYVDDLATVIQNKYPGRWLKISVAEDDENGCEIEYPVNYMPGEE